MSGVEQTGAEILQEHDELRAYRTNFDSGWQSIGEYVLPRMAHFTSEQTPGTRNDQRIFDGTAPLALERFGAAIESLLTPRTQRWHKLAPPEHLKRSATVQRWCDEKTKLLFAKRYTARANFASQAHEVYLSLGAFGTGGIMIEDDVGRGPRYKSCPLAETFMAEDHTGRVDVVHRVLKYTARQAAQKFGGIDRLPARIKAAFDKGSMDRFDFVHCVKPQTDYRAGRADGKGMPFLSVYVSVEGKQVVSEGGFRSFPFAISRYVTQPNEVYGRGPAHTVYGDIRTVNEMDKTLLRAGQKMVDPPLLVLDDGALAPFNLRSGAMNYGYLRESGEPAVQPLKLDAKLDWGAELQEGKRRTINDAFLVTLFQVLVDNPKMTATEVLERAQEKGALLAPTGGRQMSEFLGPIVSREIQILADYGHFDDMPDELVEAGGLVEIEYESPMAQAMRASEGVAILRTVEAGQVLAQVDPKAMLVIKGQETLRELASINGMPAKLLYSEDELQAINERADQAAAMAQVAGAAAPVSQAVKNLADAQATAALAPV